MALFTDGGITTLEGLLAYESSLLETARTEGIDLAVKLTLAQEELGIDLKRFLVHQGAEDLELRHVVVTEALRKCHTFRALALSYRDAYNSQLNDRYLAKWKAWERKAEWAWKALVETGVGVVEEPVEKAQPPELSVATAAAAAATYYVRVAWVNAAGREGVASEPGILITEHGQTAVVRAVNFPEYVVGWNVYAGYSHGEAMLQNAVPIRPGESWTVSESGLVKGRECTGGQKPDYYLQRAGLQKHPQPGEIPGLLIRG